MVNRKEIIQRLEKLEQLEKANGGPVFTLVYSDGRTERTRDISVVLDAVCMTPENGLIKAIQGDTEENLFQAMIDCEPVDYDAPEVLRDDQRTACYPDPERPAGPHPNPVESGGEVRGLASPPVEPERNYTRNLI